MAEYIGAPEVSCLFRFTMDANYGAHVIQLCDVGLILCWRRIRKFDENRQTENREQTDREFNYRGHSHPRGSSG